MEQKKPLKTLTLYNDGSQHCIVYNENGNPKKEATFVGDKLHGVSKHFYDNGQVQRIAHYIDNKLNGIATHYKENGELFNKAEYKDDKLNGKLIVFENNKIIKIAEYKDYQLDGQIITFYSYDDNKIKLVESYKDGKLNGKSTAYYENGNIMTELNFIDDKKDGEQTIRDEAGKLKETLIYKHGVFISKKSYHK